MDEPMIEETLYKARCAWNEGCGIWPIASTTERIAAVGHVLQSLQVRRDEIIRIILWDACKTLKEANEEFSQAMQFAESVLQEYQSSIPQKTRTSPVGVVLCWGAEANSFVDTYRILIPALVTGNVLIVKVPCVGGLVHILTMDAFTKNLPNNSIQFVTGPIDLVAAPLMNTGEINMLTLAGALSLADKLVQAHPSPHRLKLQLHLDSEALPVVLPDADLSCAASQVTKAVRRSRSHTSGLKLVLVHTSIAQPFLKELCAAIRLLKCGLPWTKGVHITPVPGVDQLGRLQELLIDALRKGAMIVNSEDGGGRLLPEFHGTIMQPAVVYPVNETMQLWRGRVTGPIIAVASYSHMNEVRAYLAHGTADLQANVFTADPTRCDLQDLLHDLPSQASALVFNQVCLEQHVSGYGKGSAGLGAGMSAGEGGWSPMEALRAYVSDPAEQGKNSSLPRLDTSLDGAEGSFQSPRRSASGGSWAEETSISLPRSFSSPIGIADLHTHIHRTHKGSEVHLS